MMKVSITVFTPTYNRADLLPRLYKSLCSQTCKDLEWLIVDDGSTDNTEEIVSKWLDNGSFPIRYFKKTNGGKHTAINMGGKLAQGELFFIADSDDYLPNDSIYTVLEIWKSISHEDITLFGGVCGLDGHEDGNIVGTGLPENILDTSVIELRDKYNVKGDMKEIYLTSIIKEFPFPEIYGECFCPEALIWNRIGEKYKLRFFNKVIYIAEYQQGGITASITRARMKSPIATMMTYAEWFTYKISIKKKIRMAINYWRFAYCTPERNIKIKSWGKLLAPFGWLMHLNDKRKIKL